MRTFFERVALATVLTSVPAIAFSQATIPEEEAAPAMDPAEQTAPAASEAEPTISPVEGQIVLQSEDTILAKDMIGLTVFSYKGKPVGDINNLIVRFDGTVEGVVIGVGGFLGIGEKEVAVELGKIELTSREDGSMILALNATREELDAAPVFKTARDQKIELQTEGAMQKIDEGLPPATASE